MRTYYGERDPQGRCIVTVVERPDEPSVSEIGDLLADLRRLSTPRPPDQPDPVDRDEWMTRKDGLLERIEASKTRNERPLPHIEVSSPDGFEWGYEGNGPGDLAHAILTDYLGVEPTRMVRWRFCKQVVANLPDDRFVLAGQDVATWVQKNRELVDLELFKTPPGSSADASWSIATHLHEATAGSGDPVIDDPATASTLVAACEAAWTDIRSHHAELPDAVMVLGSGVERGRLVKLGHWWGGQWVADGQTRGEVLLAGEALHLAPAQVFEVLLHEAAHGINAARGVKDTSRGGRYHNQRFADTAREVLLKVKAMPPYGLAATDLTPEALDRYGDTIDRLGDAMRIARQLQAGLRVGQEGTEIEGTTTSGKDGKDQGTGKTNASAASCGCGRKMRMAPSTLAAGPVVCGLCGTEFSNGAERTTDAEKANGVDSRGDAVVDRTFLDRRQAALDGNAGERGDDAVIRVLDRQRARLDAALRAVPDDGAELLRPLAERRERLLRLVGGAASDAELVPGAGQVAAANQLARDTDSTPADAHALADWYRTFGTLDETPLPAATTGEAARRERLARSLLKADGTLAGPIGRTPAGIELQAGDRIVTTVDHDDLPGGTPGTVEHVASTNGAIELDFATWGRLRSSLESDLAADLHYDYVDPTLHTQAIEAPGIEP